MKILHPKEEVDIKYLFYKMQTINFNVTQHKRYWISEYSNIKIPLPSLSEQKRIVAKLEKILSKIEKLKKLQDEQLKDLEELKKSILHKAFCGELV
jgi:type I restriction enzyme S subunit